MRLHLQVLVLFCLLILPAQSALKEELAKLERSKSGKIVAAQNDGQRELRTGVEASVVFRSAKERGFRGANGDNLLMTYRAPSSSGSAAASNDSTASATSPDRSLQPPLKLLTASFWGTAEDDDIQGPPKPRWHRLSRGQRRRGGERFSRRRGGESVRRAHGAIQVWAGVRRAFVPRPQPSAPLRGTRRGYRDFHDSGGEWERRVCQRLCGRRTGTLAERQAVVAAEVSARDRGAAHPGRPDARSQRADGQRPHRGAARTGPARAPCVLRFSPDLQSITAGTYLEGWQQVWDKDRVKTIRPREMFPKEYFWQPTSLGLFKSGDIAVGHDGGYFRLLTDKDRQLAGTNTALLSKLAFYDCSDWVSRLSPDLSKRVWRQAIQTPPVNADAARRVRDWPLPHYSSPRTHRMRLDRDENILLCGWSATHTAKEPWWSPYLWKLDATSGQPVAEFYEYDPMSGADNRMHGTVADTALATVAFDGDGNLLAGLFADGGNTVMGWSPQAVLGQKFEGPIKNDVGVKLVHWWGMIHRLDAKTGEGLGGARLASKGQGAAGPAWVVDLASLPGNQVLALGRCNLDFPWSTDAWHRGDPAENPTAFLRVYSREFDLLFSTALPGVVPFEIVPLRDNRFLITGQARNPTAPVKNALFGKSCGKADGFFCVVEASSQPTPK